MSENKETGTSVATPSPAIRSEYGLVEAIANAKNRTVAVALLEALTAAFPNRGVASLCGVKDHETFLNAFVDVMKARGGAVEMGLFPCFSNVR